MLIKPSANILHKRRRSKLGVSHYPDSVQLTLCLFCYPFRNTQHEFKSGSDSTFNRCLGCSFLSEKWGFYCWSREHNKREGYPYWSWGKAFYLPSLEVLLCLIQSIALNWWYNAYMNQNCWKCSGVNLIGSFMSRDLTVKSINL